mgnify:CR=1 FL=1
MRSTAISNELHIVTLGDGECHVGGHDGSHHGRILGHGAICRGNLPVRRVLSELGFKNVYVVPEQENPDPKFTTLD